MSARRRFAAGAAAVTAVDASGNYRTSFKLVYNTALRATYGGDAWDAEATTNATVYVRASVALAFSRQYKWSKSHAYFHKSVNPLFTTTMNPYPKRQQHRPEKAERRPAGPPAGRPSGPKLVTGRGG